MTDTDNDTWQLVLAARAAVRDGMKLDYASRFAFDGKTLRSVAAADASVVLEWANGWRSFLPGRDERQSHLDLYLPLAGTHERAPLILGQLGQSIDGFIATASGHSHYVTGESSIVHLHRLRALSDCVIVGAGTVAADDPQLTTRLVSGENCVRVVLDPQLRLPVSRRVFSDEQAPTLRVRALGVPLLSKHRAAAVEDIEIPAQAGKLDLFALVEELRSRGHHAILVEGGGATVSAFHAASLLDRIHIAVAPFIMGEGRPGLRVPGKDRLEDCLRPASRVYMLGSDVLFDCDLRKGAVGRR
jgi:diaminohydroxyphosphoribosylaminopyrimidine deaminase/5-amino-6-(5-phosphoribosylamino)uracil reductase